MKRVICCLTIVMLMAAMLVGCSNNATFSGSKTGDADHFDIEFEVLNSSFTHYLELKEGESLEVTATKESGKISLRIQCGESEPVYQGDNLESTNFKVNINESGTYTITVSGQKAKGHVVVERVMQ
ncbi:PPC domain-containing protein [Butyrivibrio sp. INlla14]|uniref:PPC domain-containing protein n=1 Tax=Butyrivibrio sp. INlla14 TaxID=1520808 RepID=UPI00087661CD|nr:PPC domain-containing protein [Butyrivibrio sp. INlla14]SCY65702.1 hypothetical protein SAMN02910371_03237 [Butyrivibrio sp. INlla14]